MVEKHSPKVISAVKSKNVYRSLYGPAIEMRESPTKAEAILWKHLRGKKMGVKFRRQHIIDRFIVDFYCVQNGLVVEVDGDIHKNQIERDKEREVILEGLGCKILRFTNEEVENNISKVLKKIMEFIQVKTSP